MRIQHRPDCHRCPMKQDSKTRQLGPQASVPDPRRHLLSAVLAFVRAARSSPGVLRIALLGSLSTNKPVPRDADVLVTIDAAMDLSSLARFGRRLKGTAQTISTAFVESTINQVVSKRFVKKQQMQWTLRGAHLLLQTRTKVLNEDLDEVFRHWYPKFRPQPQTQEPERKAA